MSAQAKTPTRRTDVFAVDGFLVSYLQSAKGYSNVEFSNLTGLSTNTLAKAKRGEGLTIRAIQNIANVLKIDLLELIVMEGKERYEQFKQV